jgi:hypothetical protein
MTSLSPTARSLLDALLARLNEVLPAGLVAMEEEGVVGVAKEGAFWGGSDYASLVGGAEELAKAEVIAVESILSTVQDQVSEYLFEPWPPGGPAEDDRLPLPFAELVGDELRLGYREALELPPIRVDQL